MTNYCIQEEIKGFEYAMEFWNKSSRIGFFKSFVVNFAKIMLEKGSKTSKSNYAQGFYDASIIVASSRNT